MKISIYIDAANILLSAKNIDFDLDLNKLFVHLKDKYKECHIVFFIGDITALKAMQETLMLNNIEVCVK